MGGAMNKKLNRYIPTLQIAGAANALAFTVWVAINGFSATLGVILFVVLAIYGLGFAGGILLWKNLRVGAALSIAYWLLIMPTFAVQQAIAYNLNNIVYGDLLFILGDTFGFKFNLSVSVFSLTFALGPAVNETAVGVDFVAIAVLIYLASHWHELDRLARVPSSGHVSSTVAQRSVNEEDVNGTPDAPDHHDEKRS